MSGDEPVTHWLRQLEAGDEDAARLLWQRYYRELVELARARLGTTPRRAIDEEDVALKGCDFLSDANNLGQRWALAHWYCRGFVRNQWANAHRSPKNSHPRSVMATFGAA